MTLPIATSATKSPNFQIPKPKVRNPRGHLCIKFISQHAVSKFPIHGITEARRVKNPCKCHVLRELIMRKGNEEKIQHKGNQTFCVIRSS